MNNHVINNPEEAIRQALGIDVNEIMNDPQLDDDQKFNAVYGQILTALLNKWIKNDTSGELGLPEGFNVDEFVKQQVAEASVTNVTPIKNMLITPNYAQLLKKAKGSAVTTEVTNLFNLANAVVNNQRFDAQAIALLMVEAGVLAISLVGAVAAITALIAQLPISALTAPAVAAVAGLVAAGFTVVASFFSFLLTIVSVFPVVNRSFYGIVLNDTDNDLLVPDWNGIQGDKKTAGIYSRHGKVSHLMIDGYDGGKNAIVGKRTVIEGKSYCNCGLYQMDKTTAAIAGSESLIRFDWNNTKFDVYSSCPFHGDNALDLSFSYVDINMYDATTKIANEWKKHKFLFHEKKGKGITVSSSLNGADNAPAYGIICVW